jgi:YHS domain-containing protein
MREGESEGGVAVDPICGRPVVEDESEEAEYKERTYYFCSDGCRKRFERQAERIHAGELARSGALFGDQRVRWGIA